MTEFPEQVMQESEPMNESMGVWKAMTCCLLTFILGAAIPLFMTRNDVTKEDLSTYLTPMQKQLDDIVRNQGVDSDQISELKISMATVTEHLKLQDRH